MRLDEVAVGLMRLGDMPEPQADDWQSLDPA